MRKLLSKLKPTWLSWPGLLGLLCQVFFSALLLIVFVGNYLGYLKPLPNAPMWPEGFWSGVIVFSVLALVAAVGIYRNRWTAYLLELLLYCVLIAAMFLIDLPEEPERLRPGYLGDVPYWKEIKAGMNLLVLVYIGWYLVERTFTLYWEQRKV